MATIAWAVLFGVVLGSYAYQLRRRLTGPVEDVI